MKKISNAPNKWTALCHQAVIKGYVLQRNFLLTEAAQGRMWALRENSHLWISKFKHSLYFHCYSSWGLKLSETVLSLIQESLLVFMKQQKWLSDEMELFRDAWVSKHRCEIGRVTPWRNYVTLILKRNGFELREELFSSVLHPAGRPTCSSSEQGVKTESW